jgi:hypothetical protein
MAKGEGKGWSRGKTAATDPRVARNAAGHLGKTYVRRTPIELCRWPNAARPRAPVGWSPQIGYVVGLIATDGCLITGRRRIDFCSSDRQLAETYVACLGRDPSQIRVERTARGALLYRVQLQDAELYRWLLTIGLTPRKSLTLGALVVPEDSLVHVVRGLLDGDGTILNSTSAADTTRRPDGSYRYEWFRTRFLSASRAHLTWLQERLRAALFVTGSLVTTVRAGHTTMSTLEFGRWDSMRLCAWLYSDPAAPRLDRKYAIWGSYAERHSGDAALAVENQTSAVARAAVARWARRDSNPHALTSRSL